MYIIKHYELNSFEELEDVKIFESENLTNIINYCNELNMLFPDDTYFVEEV